MKGSEYLKNICLECEKEKGKNKIACPFRSISNDYCYEVEAIEKDLERLEKLEKTIELLKTRVNMFEIHHGPKSRYYHFYIGGRIVLLSREEYELLKAVLENGV